MTVPIPSPAHHQEEVAALRAMIDEADELIKEHWNSWKAAEQQVERLTAELAARTEACAKVAEQSETYYGDGIAAAIRALALPQVEAGPEWQWVPRKITSEMRRAYDCAPGWDGNDGPDPEVVWGLMLAAARLPSSLQNKGPIDVRI